MFWRLPTLVLCRCFSVCKGNSNSGRMRDPRNKPELKLKIAWLGKTEDKKAGRREGEKTLSIRKIKHGLKKNKKLFPFPTKSKCSSRSQNIYLPPFLSEYPCFVLTVINHYTSNFIFWEREKLLFREREQLFCFFEIRVNHPLGAWYCVAPHLRYL